MTIAKADCHKRTRPIFDLNLPLSSNQELQPEQIPHDWENLPPDCHQTPELYLCYKFAVNEILPTKYAIFFLFGGCLKNFFFFEKNRFQTISDVNYRN
ncbi:MAG: hypothetical protein KIG22_07505 [Oxalobacter sp.]|nr:hypothetical protein [Oxalobacter sp.]